MVKERDTAFPKQIGAQDEVIRYWAGLLLALGLAIGVITIGRYAPQIIFLDNGYISLAVCAVPYVATFIVFYIVTGLIIARKRFD